MGVSVAGDRTIYEEALRTGSARAWEQRWEEAVAAYQRALDEFPDDPDALSGLGLALSGAGRLEEALQAFRRAAEVEKEDPTLLEHTAQVLEQLGRAQEAARAYLAAAERHTHRQAPSLALQRWKDAVRVDPSCIPARVHLLRAYLTQHKTYEALAEYLALANVYQAQGQTQQALELCQHALKLDPHNPEVLALMDRLRLGEGAPPSPVGTGPLDFPSPQEEMIGEKGNPVETTRQKALADLAEAVFDETPPQTGPLILRPLSKRQVDALISKALDCQTKGEIDMAIECYEEVLQGGVIQPAVNFNLGLLYQQQLRFEEAVEQFQRSIDTPEYRLGSHFALGECYRALGQIDQALAHFIEVLKIVDLGTVRREQADDLIQLYEELAHTYAAKGEREQAVEFVNTLISFLNEKGWEDKVAQARQRLDALAREGPVLSLAEILAVPGSQRILQSIGLAQEYQRRGMGYAALDELGHAISLAPTFLPVHRQMGETLVSMGRVDRAVAKFLVIADVYRVRSNFSQAMAMYERALRLAPMDVAVRTRLIDLLVSHGEIDRALEHYLALGDTYYQMAQLDRAREKYNEALQLAPRGDPKRGWTVRLLHRIGDIDMQRVDWRQAIRVYEQIRDLAPDDERARLTLMELYRRFDRPERAIRELDDLLRLYRQTGRTQKAIAILQERVEEQPDNIPLRARLAQVHLNAGNVTEALQQLDVLGDLQLQAGHMKDAIVTIKAILRLNPPNADAYRQLLEQLTAG
ncbi:MAG TPA: tetratricopeptide repeat protein [Anaerolineales bacterium]|nr:tetratricopeptide repeat protein [Anaerolineae bacterium]HIQ00891.1 tetratricopeptide repeat protein [Anaerolineales bacterium]